MKETRARLWPAAVLTAAFLGTVFAFCLTGLLRDPPKLIKAVQYTRASKFLAPGGRDTDFFDMTQARIASLQDRLEGYLPASDALHVANASFQYALGKRMVVVGADQMLKLPNGQLYYITSRQSLAEEADELGNFLESLPEDLPRFYSWVHPGFFYGGQPMGEGYSQVDTSDELADQVLSRIRAGNMVALDSREFLSDRGYTSDELELKTDKHWTTLAALLTARTYGEMLETLTGVDLPLERLDPENFDTETYPDLFFGDFGQLVGQRNSVRDDITVYLPRYATHITRHSEHRTGDIEDEEGPFDRSVLRRQKLTSEQAYTDYGLIEAYEELTNPDGADMTLLVLRDSYSEPVCSFLSLAVGKVVSADLRYCQYTGRELIERVQPDALIVSYSRLMFEDHTYRLE